MGRASGRGDVTGEGPGEGPGDAAWTSGLTAGEFTCLRAAGFTPVGPVMGAAVCVREETLEASDLPAWDADPARAARSGAVVRLARLRAMDRLDAECRALGGDGTVGVRVEIGPFPGEVDTLVFRVHGTAVRAEGRVRPPRPFSCDLSAQEFTRLLDAGWIPAGLVLGVARVWVTRPVAARLGRRREIGIWSRAVTGARRHAGRLLAQDAARLGADGVVVSRRDLTIADEGGLGHHVEARFVGTAIAAFGAARPRRPTSPETRLEALLPAPRRPAVPPPSVHPVRVLRLSADAQEPWTGPQG